MLLVEPKIWILFTAKLSQNKDFQAPNPEIVFSTMNLKSVNIMIINTSNY